MYVAKAGKKERDAGVFTDPKEGDLLNTRGGIKLTGSGNPRSTERKNNHPTVKPIALMRWLVRMVTPPGGTVLDPFAGSGSTGLAAQAEGFEAVLVELDPDYAALAESRNTHLAVARAIGALGG